MYTKNTGCNGQAEIGSFSNRINFIPSKISGGFSLRITLADFLNISGAIHTKIYLITKIVKLRENFKEEENWDN